VRVTDAMIASASKSHAWHALGVADAVAAVQSNGSEGLTTTEAHERLARVGPNALPEARRRSLLAVFGAQFKTPLIYLLFAASAIAFFLGHVSDAIVIAVVVVVNAVIGAFQEGRAERSLEALRRMTAHKARVIRDGHEVLVEARDLVPGDVLVLDAGDAVSADARLLHGAALQLAEASLTGESVPVAKDLLPVAPDTPLGDRRNMIYAGTHVTAGRARAVIVATGLDTELGRIAALAGGAQETRTPLERRIAQFGRYVIVAGIIMFTLVVGIGFARGIPVGQVLMIGISQLVSMIPEGLPVAMTIALAVGVQRMAKRRAVIRRLAAVETLGSTTIICTDKTGTLTKNEMTATALVLPSGRTVAVSGIGYAAEGDLLEDGRPLASLRDDERMLLEAAVLCNDAQLYGPSESQEGWTAVGDPTEIALVTLAVKAGIVPADVRERFGRRAEIPFDAASKMMATQHQGSSGTFVIVKGAPEAVLERCHATRRDGRDVPLDADTRAQLLVEVDAMARRALRVLAIGRVDGGAIEGSAGFEPFDGRITLLGLVGQIDPPRPEVKDAVARCRAAGIRPVMVTGDHKATALAIAKELGIALPEDEAIDGRELETITDSELAARIGNIAVFARVHPAQKLRIVEAYQRRGEVVTMTGDGVNDAPALARADVGVAMGISGTEVAKEASKIVIADDNFATIVSAVEEGRVVYRNIKKTILYLFSTSMAEILILLAALLLGYPPPLAAVQILWINLVTEGTVTVNLILEPAEGDEMRQRPISGEEPLITRALLARVALMTPVIAACTFGWFATRLASGVVFEEVQTETFTLLAVCAWFNVLNCRSATHSALSRDLFKNRWLVGGLVLGILLQLVVVFWDPMESIFHTTSFDLGEALAIIAVGSIVLWVEELRKLVLRHRRAATPASHVRGAASTA
jgi:magnesium-transporting ATPase (P-type)